MEYKLVVVSGEARQKEVVIKPPAVIGRSREADVTLGHPLVSRRHCAITADDDGLLVVEDLGSLNGTFHGEQRITEPVYLEPGDLLSIGSVTFRAVYGDYKPEDEPEDEPAAQASDDDLPDFTALAASSEAAPSAAQPAANETPPDFDATIDPPAAEQQAADLEEPEEVEEAEEAEELEETAEAEAEEVEEIEEVAEAEPEEAEEPEAAAEPEEAEEPAAEPQAEKQSAEDESGFQFSWLEDDEEGSASNEEQKASSSDVGLDDFFKNLK